MRSSNNNAIGFYSKTFLLLCLVVLFYSSCKKEKIVVVVPPPVVIDTINDSISGILYRNCNLEPDTNRKVIVLLLKNEGDVVTPPEWTDTIFTDSMGRFKVIHSYTTNHRDNPSFFVIFPPYCAAFWPSASLSPYHPFFTNDTMHAVVKLQVNNSHSSSDTLYYQFGSSPLKSLIGPFSNGIAGNYDIPHMQTTLDSSVVGFYWAIGYNNMPFNGGDNYKYKVIWHLPCTSSDTVTIDLN